MVENEAKEPNVCLYNFQNCLIKRSYGNTSKLEVFQFAEGTKDFGCGGD